MRQVEDLLAPLQQALSADGATLELAGIEGSELRLSLDTAEATCAECIVPDEIIESMVLTRLADAEDPGLAAIQTVRIEHVDALTKHGRQR